MRDCSTNKNLNINLTRTPERHPICRYRISDNLNPSSMPNKPNRMTHDSLAFIPSSPFRPCHQTAVSPNTSRLRPQTRSFNRRAHARIHRCPYASATTPTTVSRDQLFRLQNGSDVRGVSSALIAEEPVTLTPAIAFQILAAFVRKLAKEKQVQPSTLRVALGRDSRISGPELLAAAAAGVISTGAAVTDFGLATTPAMFMATVLPGYEYDCACMLTASHLPPNRNGIKFFTKKGSANKADIKEILSATADAIESNGIPNVESSPVVEKLDFLSVYAEHLVNLIRTGCNDPTNRDQPLKGFKIVVDAGNGAAGFFATQVLEPLGADVVGQFLEPDGMFPNHVPNPENKQAMSMTIDTVKRVNANLGIIFDTDVDRSGVVDSEGLGINRNRLIALMARIVLREYPGSTIVTDSVTSNGLKRFIEAHGGKHFRYRKGYKNVIDKGIELNEAGIQTELAIETSGHGAMKENYMLDDGAYLAVKILIEMVKLRLAGDETGIGGLLKGLDAPMEEFEFRLPIDLTDFRDYGASAVEAFKEFGQTVSGWTVDPTNYEGYRISVDEGNGRQGWLLLRISLHDPILVLNIESEVSGGISNIARILIEGFFPDFPKINIKALSDRASNE